MRVLHVVHGFVEDAPAGTERHAAELAARQASAEGGGHDVALFARVRRPQEPDFGLCDDGTRDGVRRFAFNHLGRRALSFRERDDLPAAVAAFERAADAFRPDVVHVHHLAGLSLGIVAAAKRRGARVALTLHDHALACPRGRRVRPDLAPCPTLDRDRCARCVRPAWIEAARAPDRFAALCRAFRPGESRRLFDARDAFVRAALAEVDVFLAPSRSAAELFREFFDPGPRLAVVPHGSPAGVAAAPPPPPTSGRCVRVGFFGAPHPTKGAHVVAAAVPLLRAPPQFVVHGAATDAERRRLKTLAGGRASFPGPYRADEFASRMADVDVVVVPSLFPETFNLTMREAWACRRPVVVSRVGALVEAVGAAEERGLTAPPGDVGAWARTLDRLRGDPALFARLTGPFADPPRAAALDAATAAYGLSGSAC